MPEIGDITYNREKGKKYKWIKCPTCGKERWVEAWHYAKYKNSDYCRSCAQKYHRHNRKGGEHPSWKGGRIEARWGYIQIKLQPNDPFYPMVSKNGYVLEHRLIMAQNLGRLLRSWEIVHHKNHIKIDNRIENLELTTRKSHNHNNYEIGYRDGYERGYSEGQGKPKVEVTV